MGPIPALSFLLALTALALESPSSGRSEVERWARAMLDARQEFHRNVPATSFLPAVTDVRHGGDEPVRLEVDVSGLDELWLIIDAVPDYHHAQSMWGEAVLFDAGGEATRVSAMRPTSVAVGWGSLLIDVDIHGGPMEIGSRTFEHGLWAHANSALSFDLGGRYTRLETWAGIEADAGEKGGARFTVSDRPPRREVLQGAIATITTEFPDQARLTRQLGVTWLSGSETLELEREIFDTLMRGLGPSATRFSVRRAELVAAGTAREDPAWLVNLARAESLAMAFEEAERRLELFDPTALNRAGDVHALGVHRPPPLQLAHPLPDEPRRDAADGAVRQQLLLAHGPLLRPTDARGTLRGDRQRPPRCGPDGRAGDLRPGAGA